MQAHFVDHMWETVRCDGKLKLKSNAVPTIFPSYTQPCETISVNSNDKDISEMDVTIDDWVNEESIEAKQQLELNNTIPEDHPNKRVHENTSPEDHLNERINENTTSENHLNECINDNTTPEDYLSEHVVETTTLEDHLTERINEITTPQYYLNKRRKENSEKQYENLTTLLKKSEQRCKDLTNFIEKRERQFRKTIKRNHEYKIMMKKRFKKLEEDLQTYGKLKTMMFKVFKEDQVKVLTNPNKKVTWSKETIQRAIRLKLTCGSNGYQEILNQNIPLPSERTLRRNIETIDFKEGICNDILDILSSKIKTFTDDTNKDCILAIDEMSITSGTKFDQSTQSYCGYTTLPDNKGK